MHTRFVSEKKQLFKQNFPPQFPERKPSNSPPGISRFSTQVATLRCLHTIKEDPKVLEICPPLANFQLSSHRHLDFGLDTAFNQGPAIHRNCHKTYPMICLRTIARQKITHTTCLKWIHRTCLKWSQDLSLLRYRNKCSVNQIIVVLRWAQVCKLS